MEGEKKKGPFKRRKCWVKNKGKGLPRSEKGFIIGVWDKEKCSAIGTGKLR